MLGSIPLTRVPAAFAAIAASALAGASARGDCTDRVITVPGTTGTIACSGVNTCAETNTYDPSPGCAMAFGSPVATPGRDLLYTVLLPPGMALDVLAIPAGNWDVALYALSSDDPAQSSASCLGGVDAAFNGGEEVLRDLVNRGGVVDTLFVVIDSASSSAKFGCGIVNVEFRHRPVAGGLGDTCSEPVDVEWSADAFEVSLSSCENTNAYTLAGGKCAQAFPDTLVGRDVVFRVVVEDSTAWTATVVPTSAWDPAVLVSRSCTDDFTGGCVAAVDDGRIGEAESVPPILNPAGAGPLTYYLLVDSWLGDASAAGCGSMEVRFSRMAAGEAAGETCSGPIPISIGAEPLSVSAFSCGFTHDVDPALSCSAARGGSLPGRDVVYAVTVGSESWSASVTPVGEWDVALAVLSGCADACVALADTWGAGTAEMLGPLENLAPGTTYHLVVDSRVAPGSPGGCGQFRLDLAPGGVVPTRATSWGALKSRYAVAR